MAARCVAATSATGPANTGRYRRADADLPRVAWHPRSWRPFRHRDSACKGAHRRSRQIWRAREAERRAGRATGQLLRAPICETVGVNRLSTSRTWCREIPHLCQGKGFLADRICPLCDATMRADSLTDHLRRRHGAVLSASTNVVQPYSLPAEPAAPQAPDLVKCPDCGAPVSPHRLERHRRRVHQSAAGAVAGAGGMQKCRICGVVLPRCNYKYHIRVTHRLSEKKLRRALGEGQRTCGDCKRSYPVAEYDFHVCRPRSPSVFTIQGGSPGQGKRR